MPEPAALSIRIDLPNGTRFGPGKAKLLGCIDKTGSIAAAARKLGMSYPRALRLVNEMNTQFETPLIEKFQGGANHGGAKLTASGVNIQSLYLRIVAASAKVAKKDVLALYKFATSNI